MNIHRARRLFHSIAPFSSSSTSYKTMAQSVVEPTATQVRESLSPTLRSLVSSYPSLVNIPVHWGEQDAYGHLNNVVYVRYAETSRIAFINQVLGPQVPPEMHESFIRGTHLGPILKSITMNYKIPVVFPDVIVMASRVPSASISTDRFKQEFIAVSLAQERVVCTGEALIVSFDYKAQTKAPLPEIVTRVLKSVDAEYSQPPQKISKL